MEGRTNLGWASSEGKQHRLGSMVRVYVFLSGMMILLLGQGGAVCAQGGGGAQVPEVTAFLSHMERLQSFRAEISMVIDNQRNGVKSSYEGRLAVRGNAFHFVGMGMEVFSDGKVRWQYLPREREVTVFSVDTLSASPIDSPMRMLRNIKADFKTRFRGERREGGRVYYDLTLYPKDVRVPYSQIHLAVVKSSLNPEKITYQGKDGMHYVVHITDFDANAAVRKTFRFEPPRGENIEVIDLR